MDHMVDTEAELLQDNDDVEIRSPRDNAKVTSDKIDPKCLFID